VVILFHGSDRAKEILRGGFHDKDMLRDRSEGVGVFFASRLDTARRFGSEVLVSRVHLGRCLYSTASPLDAPPEDVYWAVSSFAKALAEPREPEDWPELIDSLEATTSLRVKQIRELMEGRSKPNLLITRMLLKLGFDSVWLKGDKDTGSTAIHFRPKLMRPLKVVKVEKLAIRSILKDPTILRDVSNRELTSLHRRTHQLHTLFVQRR